MISFKLNHTLDIVLLIFSRNHQLRCKNPFMQADNEGKEDNVSWNKLF